MHFRVLDASTIQPRAPMIYPPDIAPHGATNDGSLAGLLTNIDNKPADVLDLESRLQCRTVRSLIVHALLLFLASTFFALWVNTLRTSCPLDPLLSYSPVNEAIQYVETQFDGRMDSASVFRGYPSPEIDAAWMRVSFDVKAARLSREQYLMVAGNESSAAVKFRPEDGGGYMAQVFAYHTVHCLDMVRKYIRRDYYAAFDISFNDKIHPHVGHCVDMLRQKLMCTSDLTMVSYDWVPGLDNPQPNLSTVHQCVDFERILDWSDTHNAHVLKGHVVRFGDAMDLLEEPMKRVAS